MLCNTPFQIGRSISWTSTAFHSQLRPVRALCLASADSLVMSASQAFLGHLPGNGLAHSLPDWGFFSGPRQSSDPLPRKRQSRNTLQFGTEG